MFRKTQAGERDERLSALLRQWTGIEPKANFEANVWRRIRTEGVAQPAGIWDRWLDWFLPHPVWAGLAVVSVAMVIGLAAGAVTPGNAQAGVHETHALLHPRTLMGTYLTLSAGDRP